MEDRRKGFRGSHCESYLSLFFFFTTTNKRIGSRYTGLFHPSVTFPKFLQKVTDFGILTQGTLCVYKSGVDGFKMIPLPYLVKNTKKER